MQSVSRIILTLQIEKNVYLYTAPDVITGPSGRAV